MHFWTIVALIVGLVPGLVLSVAPPASFEPNPKVGPGGTKYKDSAHFRIVNASNDTQADGAIKYLEAAYSCYMDDLGWRSPGLSFKSPESEDGPYYKLNVYRVDNIPGAAANTGTDMNLGFPFLNVVTQYMTEPSVTVHEFGHAMTYAAFWWIDQKRTGAWWETIANFVADTYLTSAACAPARSRNSQPEGKTLVNLGKVISSAYQVIVDGTSNTGNYYEAWPFLTYMFNNPDNYTGLGHSIFPNMWTKYKRNSNETPLHVLDRLVQPGMGIQKVVGRYWARMAYVDIGHPKMQQQFTSQRKSLNYANLDSQGGGKYRVKAARQPRYMGASIIPLTGTGAISVNVTAATPFIATLAVKGSAGAVRYIDLAGGNGQATLTGGEEASLVVVNTPATLYLYDPFSLTADVSKGLDYQVQITGATA